MNLNNIQTTFVSLNNPSKVSAEALAAWVRVLRGDTRRLEVKRDGKFFGAAAAARVGRVGHAGRRRVGRSTF